MKFIRKNKNTIVGILVFILVLAGIFAIKSVMSSDEKKAIYGTRLKGRDSIKITDSRKKEVENKLANDTEKVEVSVAGRIINILITAKEGTSLEDAKKLGDKAVEVFSSAEKKYYDIQIFITNEKNEAQFPIIGYRHHTKETITWTKDRAES